MKSAFGTIDRRGNTYRVRWREHGTRTSKSFRSQEEANKFLAKITLEHGNVDRSITFNEYYESAVKPSMSRLSKRTRYDYDKTWRRIKPYIGKYKMTDCNRRIIQNIIDKFESPSAQRHAIVLIRKICNLAIADDIILKNPVTRHIQRDKEVKMEKNLYDVKALKNALKKCSNTEFALILLFCCCGGMRPEEAFAINKRDIDFSHNGHAFINVDKALTTVNGRKILKETKTSYSNRLVTLSGSLVEYLIKNKANIRNYKTLKEYPVPNNFAKRWKRFCINNDLLFVKIGDMRSVYATLCAEAGCLDSVVSQSMGHSGRNMKERNYQSLTMKAMMMNADYFSSYISY